MLQLVSVPSVEVLAVEFGLEFSPLVFMIKTMFPGRLMTDLALEALGMLGVGLGRMVVVTTTTLEETTSSLEVVVPNTGVQLGTPVDNETPVGSNTLVPAKGDVLSEEFGK